MTVVRPDLSERTGLSKSLFTSFEWCQQASWFSKWARLPFVPNPAMTFGSAVDAGVEAIITYLRMGQEPDMDRAMAAAEEGRARNEVEIDMAEVRVALEAFFHGEAGRKEPPVAEQWDWAYARLQAHVHVTLDGIGEIDGHPDIILPHVGVLDIKTSTRSKETAKTVELGTYALMVEEETGEEIPEVGYLTYVRLVKPVWQTVVVCVDDDFREWTRQRWGGFVRANNADDLLNRRRTELDLPPENYSFPGGPVNGKRCRTCQYNPSVGAGGRCQMAVTETLPGGYDDA
jgi:CRISPR/Cas system-associated exonuclease Cas4 (RecB family)